MDLLLLLYELSLFFHAREDNWQDNRIENCLLEDDDAKVSIMRQCQTTNECTIPPKVS
jgi:hypothetical protein